MSPDRVTAFRQYEEAGAYHYRMMAEDLFYIAKIRKAVSLVRRGARVLDVGCGDGVFVKYAREAGATVIGIDAMEDGVRLARTMAGTDALCVGAAHLLPIRASSMDVVVMIDLVNYLSDAEAAIREAARTLTPNGILVIMSPCDVSLEAERAAIPHSWQVRAWSVEELRVITDKYLCRSQVTFIEKVAPVPALAVLARWMRAARLDRLVRQLASVLRPASSRRSGGIPPPGEGSESENNDIVLNTLSLPRWLSRGTEKLEFVLVARR